MTDALIATETPAAHPLGAAGTYSTGSAGTTEQRADVLTASQPGTAASTTTPAEPVLTFIAHGTPGPQGSKTGYNVGGRVVMRESSAKVKPWRSDVRDAAIRVILTLDNDWTPIDGPVAVDMVFTLRKPASAPKRRRVWPDRTPDLSKLARSTEDALTGLVWADDARIVEYRTLAKRYPLEGADALTYPGVLVRVYLISDLSPATSPAARRTGR